MLIENAQVWGNEATSVRLNGDRIAEIGHLDPREGEDILDARGGLLLPGLHDHHIHLAGTAVRQDSLWCGPPEVRTRRALAERLTAPGESWLRGIGYHETVLGGLPDARELDALCTHRPLRMQHRSGRMWFFNSCGLDAILARAEAPPGLERVGGRFTGRLFDEDAWLREALGSEPPDFAVLSMQLARKGVTGITDMTPQNDPQIARHFTRQMQSGRLLQKVTLAGTASLAQAEAGPWHLGPVKLHLHEAALPDFDQTVGAIAAAHDSERPVAVHCVSEVELVFAIAAIEAAGARRGDRIEHCSVASPELVARMAELGLWVCVQPHFVAERGDQYLADVDARHVPDLYRLQSLADAGLALAGGSDAPFADTDPWAAMRAALARRTPAGKTVGAHEALSPEAALALYLADPKDLSRQRRIEPGACADLCLLRTTWSETRKRLGSEAVAATFVSGRLVFDDRIDQS